MSETTLAPMALITWASTLIGAEAVPARVEVTLLDRLPAFCLVGGSSRQAKEMGERVRSAIAHGTSHTYPRKRVLVEITVGGEPVAPSRIGPEYDVAVALGILAASGQIDDELLGGFTWTGELTLGGDVRRVRGSLARCVDAAAPDHQRRLVLPAGSPVLPGMPAHSVATLADAVALAGGAVTYLEALEGGSGFCDLETVELPTAWPDVPAISPHARNADRLLAADRAVAAAVSGGATCLLLVGAPGSGKTLLARRVVQYMAPLDDAGALHVACVFDAVGLPVPASRPFRAPHHTVSVQGMAGTRGRLGELALAHGGVLLLDEAAEFSRPAMDAVRCAARPFSFLLVLAVHDDAAAQRVVSRLGDLPVTRIDL